jgi:hypothetical protein
MNAWWQRDRSYLALGRILAGVGTGLVLFVLLPRSRSTLLLELPTLAMEAVCGALLFWGCAAPILQLAVISYLATLAWKRSPVCWTWVAYVLLICFAHLMLLIGSNVDSLAPYLVCAIGGVTSVLLVDAFWFRQKHAMVFAVASVGAAGLYLGMLLALEVAKAV